MVHYKEISFDENADNLKKFKKNSLIKVRILEIKDEKIRLSIRALEKDPMDWFKANNKKIGSIISTKVVEVLKTGVKVAVDPEKVFSTITSAHSVSKKSASGYQCN